MWVAYAMRNNWTGVLPAVAFLTVIAGASLKFGERVAARDEAAIQMSEHRQSELDLEVSGDLPGVPAGAARYISREDLLKLPQVTYAVTDDANFAGRAEVSGVLLSELMKALAVEPAGKMVVAICVDQYHAHYPQEYIQAHQPVLALKVNGLPPKNWPTNAEVHGASMGPFLISHAKFTPRFKILSHEDEPQIPWGVVRLEFRGEAAVLQAIAPGGAHADDQAVRNGYIIAQQNCFRCHDNAGEGGKKSGRPWPVLATWAAAGPQRFAAYVRNPQAVNAKSQMAASLQYDEATMQALIAYFRTFLPESKQ